MEGHYGWSVDTEEDENMETQYYAGHITWCLLGRTKFGPYSRVIEKLLKGFKQNNMTKLHFSKLILATENGLALKEIKSRYGGRIHDGEIWREMRNHDGNSGDRSARGDGEE